MWPYRSKSGVGPAATHESWERTRRKEPTSASLQKFNTVSFVILIPRNSHHLLRL